MARRKILSAIVNNLNLSHFYFANIVTRWAIQMVMQKIIGKLFTIRLLPVADSCGNGVIMHLIAKTGNLVTVAILVIALMMAISVWMA